MENKRKIICVCLISFVLLAILGVALSFTLKSSQGESVGLFNHGDETVNDLITQEQYDEEYQSREELPETTMESLNAAILGKMSAGQFIELDAQLKELGETYKDNADQSDNESIVIDNYRADVAYYLSMLNKEALGTWYFYNPETLAAAVAYAPISVKYKSFINRDSAILPPAAENVLLQKVELEPEQYKSLLNSINEQRTDSNKFLSVSVFDMKILGYPCRLIEVRDPVSYCYQPYALIVNDPTYYVNAAFIDKILLETPDANVDSMFVAPTQIPDITDENEVPNENQ